MPGPIRTLHQGAWGLDRARRTAQEIADNPTQLRALIRILLADDPERRKRAADVAHRLTESSPQALAPHADILADCLAELAPEESRTRWHLALAVPRIAQTHAQRIRAARLLSLFAEDESTVVRCSVVEGLATLALAEPSLRPEAEQCIAHFLHAAAPAMRSRARRAGKLLADSSARRSR